jgi:hypothetical protein
MAAKLWPNDDPIGKRALRELDRFRDAVPVYRTVIGGRQERAALRADDAVVIEVYVSLNQAGRRWGTRCDRAQDRGDPEHAMTALRGLLANMDRDATLCGCLMASTPPRGAGRWRDDRSACCCSRRQIFGVMSYAVSRKTKEIGIRAALGATPRDVMAAGGRALGLTGLGLVPRWRRCARHPGARQGAVPGEPLDLRRYMGDTPAGRRGAVAARLPARRATWWTPATVLNEGRVSPGVRFGIYLRRRNPAS